MELEPDDLVQAGRLIQWGLRSKRRPAQEPEYLELIERYLDQSAFRANVGAIARGLGLSVLDAGMHGIVLAAVPGSEFELNPRDFRPSMQGADDRLLDGLVQLAIAATLFPRAQDLEEEATVARPPVTVAEIDDALREICNQLADEVKGTTDPEAGPSDGLIEAWRVYHARPSRAETRDGRYTTKSTHGVISYNLERLKDHGCFTTERRDEETLYQPTWRYQVLVKELAALDAFERVRRALVARDGSEG